MKIGIRACTTSAINFMQFQSNDLKYGGQFSSLAVMTFPFVVIARVSPGKAYDILEAAFTRSYVISTLRSSAGLQARGGGVASSGRREASRDRSILARATCPRDDGVSARPDATGSKTLGTGSGIRAEARQVDGSKRSTFAAPFCAF